MTPKLWKNELYSDVRIICSDGTVIPAHKCILASHSEFFAKAFDQRLGFEEAKSGELHMRDDLPFAVEAMLEYIYTKKCTYPFRSSVKSSDEKAKNEPTDASYAFKKPGPVVFNIEVYKTAEKYMVEELCCAIKRYLGTLDENDTAEDIISAAVMIYSTPSFDSLRCRFLKGTIDFSRDSDYKYQLSRDDLMKCPEFAVDLAVGLADECHDLEHTCVCTDA